MDLDELTFAVSVLDRDNKTGYRDACEYGFECTRRDLVGPQAVIDWGEYTDSSGCMTQYTE